MEFQSSYFLLFMTYPNDKKMNEQNQKSPNVGLLDEEGICMLSLDGGGVRGLSSLYVLKRIMDGYNAERKKLGQSPQKPADIFDLIGGTSTGG